MIASSCFEGNAAFDLQIVAGVCNLGLQPQARRWYNHCLFLMMHTDKHLHRIKCQRAPSNQVKSVNGTARPMLIANRPLSWKPIQAICPCKGDKTDIQLISIAITGIRGMHDYKLLWKIIIFHQGRLLAYQSMLGWEDDDGQEKTLSRQGTKQSSH